jgi:hypothetical protein
MANPSPPEYPVPDAEDQRMADLHAYRDCRTCFA